MPITLVAQVDFGEDSIQVHGEIVLVTGSVSRHGESVDCPEGLDDFAILRGRRDS